MAGRYDKFRALAQKLILKNADGQTLDLTHINDETAANDPDPWNGADEPERETLQASVPFVSFSYKAAETAFQSSLTSGSAAGKLLVADARQLIYMAAADFDARPKAGQRLDASATKKWEILELEVIAPGPDDILYIAYVGD